MCKKKFVAIIALVTGLCATSMTVNAAPKTMPDGTVFDAEYYAQTYPDVKAAFGNDESALYNHYVQYGKKEGRKPCGTSGQSSQTVADNFDAKYYAETYPDVKAAFGNDATALYNHYINFGKKEGRKPCAETVTSPVAGATLVSSYETWGAAAKTYRVEQYSNGIWISRAIKGWEGCDPKYWILRTDYSDCLLDKDGNGIDDRDPYNNCGYTDLNHNCMADGAPSLEMFVPENEHTPFWTCRHGIVNGTYICQRAECEETREVMKRVVVY